MYELMRAQTEVSQELDSTCRLVVRSWRSLSVMVGVYDLAVRLIVFALAITWLLRKAFLAYTAAVGRLSSNELALPAAWAACLAAASVGAWFLTVLAPFDHLNKRHQSRQPFLVLAQSLIAVPASAVLIERTLNHLLGSDPSYSTVGALAGYST
jgi:arginine exporter protein ArgO